MGLVVVDEKKKRKRRGETKKGSKGSSTIVVGKTLGALTKGRKRKKHGSSILSKDKRKTKTTMTAKKGGRAR